MQARAFIGAVLAPHHREDAFFGFGWLAAKYGTGFVEFAGREVAHAALDWVVPMNDCTSDSKITRPSEEPSSASAARSGCGIIPITFRRSLSTPAILRSEPLGLST